MKPRHKKLAMIVAGVAALGVASVLVLDAGGFNRLSQHF